METKEKSYIDYALFNIIPTKKELILLYKHTKNNKLDFSNLITSLSLKLYMDSLKEFSNDNNS